MSLTPKPKRLYSSPNILLVNVLVLVLSMTAVVSAHPSLSNLYDEYFRHSPSVKIGLNRCFNCKQWESCWWGSCHIPIAPAIIYAERLWEALVAFAATFEVLLRGFTLGFGIRMLKYLFWEGASEVTTDRASLLESFRNKALVSAIAGLSLAAFLHGSSIFVPAEVREEWFDYNLSASAPNSNLPLALYDHIRTKIIREYQSDEGTLECPSDCSGETCNETVCVIDLDVTAYVIGRLGTGLSYLATTLEVLLRGFSLGFGARMLKFLFFPVQSVKREEKDDVQTTKEAEEKDDFVPVPKNTTEEEDIFDSFEHRAIVSAVSGISVSAVIHGSSIFVPTRLRDRWFVQGIDSEEMITLLANITGVAFTFAVFAALCYSCWPRKR